MSDFEERLSRAEERIQLEARLRALGDKDLSDLKQGQKAMIRSIQALADTQSEHTRTLAEHSAKLDSHTATLARHSETLDVHTGLLVAINERLDHMDGRFDGLEGRLETLETRTSDMDLKLDRILSVLQSPPPPGNAN